MARNTGRGSRVAKKDNSGFTNNKQRGGDFSWFPRWSDGLFPEEDHPCMCPDWLGTCVRCWETRPEILERIEEDA